MKKCLITVLVVCILGAVVFTLFVHYPPKQALNEDTKARVIDTKAEAVNFLSGKFSITELKEFARIIKSGTPQEKEEVKAVLKQRMTEEEYQAINNILQGELKKTQNK